MTDMPLQSETICSERGFRSASHIAAAVDRDTINHHSHGAMRASRCGAFLAVRTRYEAFEGVFATGPYLRIGLSMAHAGAVMQQAGGMSLSGLWRPSQLVITPPHVRGTVRSDPLAMLGIAIDLDQSSVAGSCDHDRLVTLASDFLVDDLLASVLTALWYEADEHGASSAFFEHGVALVVQRLGAYRMKVPAARTAAPLPLARLDRLRDYVEARLGQDVSVADMAAICGMEPSGFGRALRARVGLPPFAWLTRCRMERGKILLAQGLPVTQVANLVGYANPGKFAAAFRRFTGTTPSMWQRTPS